MLYCHALYYYTYFETLSIHTSMFNVFHTINDLDSINNRSVRIIIITLNIL